LTRPTVSFLTLSGAGPRCRVVALKSCAARVLPLDSGSKQNESNDHDELGGPAAASTSLRSGLGSAITRYVTKRDIPLLGHPLNEPSAFTAEALVAAVRAERSLALQSVPRICILEFDGDLTDWLVETGHARAYKNWPCFHTNMHTIDIGGNTCGIIARTIGGPYAVLVAEQLRASGAELILGLTSAGRVSRSLPLPSLVVAQQAIRDEGTSYHYIAADKRVAADPDLAHALVEAIKDLGLPVSTGAVWTTDAPYRETQRQLDTCEPIGVLAVEMQAASLFAFSQATGMPTGIVALVSNAVDHTQDTFNKGSYEFGQRLVETMCRAAAGYLSRR
jgi:uridine phosphorylase